MAANDDDLYGDLDDAAVAKSTGAKPAAPLPSAAAMGAHPNAMMSQPEMAQLQRQVQALKSENEVLKRNIGILYRTAKSELERKDRAIDTLQNELDSMRR
ncbi:hypothetical protein ACHAXT_003213 [Thalassiosira profunda]